MTQAAIQPSISLFVDQVTILDFAYLGEDGRAHGESYFVSAELKGTLDEQGFVLDFGRAKKLLKQQIDECLDHRLALSEVQLAQLTKAAPYFYQCPREALAIFASPTVDMASTTLYLEEKIRPLLGPNIESLKITLEPESRFDHHAHFRYTHGLKLHDGNCQRLIHGHKNIIEVFVNKMKNPELEAELAKLFDDVHFTTQSNLPEYRGPLNIRNCESQDSTLIQYRSSQGDFVAQWPVKDLIVLAQEPSIENITRMAWEYLRHQHGDLPGLAVHGYEGLQKGAIVCAES